MSGGGKLAPEEIRRRAASLGPWFHNMELGGVRTAPDHFLGDYPAVKWARFAHAIPQEPVREDYDFWEKAQFDRPGWPKLHFVERRYAGDATNWWVPNAACAEAMLRSAGFEVLGRPEAEVYVCRRAEAPCGPGAVYPAGGPRA